MLQSEANHGFGPIGDGSQFSGPCPNGATHQVACTDLSCVTNWWVRSRPAGKSGNRGHMEVRRQLSLTDNWDCCCQDPTWSPTAFRVPCVCTGNLG